jgi:hypothetical protein
MLTPETLLSPMGLLWDEVMMSRHYASKPGTCTNAYMRIQQWHSGDGAGDPQGKILSATLPAAARQAAGKWVTVHVSN